MATDAHLLLEAGFWRASRGSLVLPSLYTLSMDCKNATHVSKTKQSVRVMGLLK